MQSALHALLLLSNFIHFSKLLLPLDLRVFLAVNELKWMDGPGSVLEKNDRGARLVFWV